MAGIIKEGIVSQCSEEIDTSYTNLLHSVVTQAWADCNRTRLDAWEFYFLF